MKNLNANHPAVQEGRTLYKTKVQNADDRRVLKKASNNSKLGGPMKLWQILKGKWKGLPCFSLTLEERKTCPKSCFHYTTCYGNNMIMGIRWKHNKQLWKKIEDETQSLTSEFKSGIVIRLHVLGDFYSVPYVKFWEKIIVQYPVYIWGYTAWLPHTKIGKEINRLRSIYSDRFKMRWSHGGYLPMSANSERHPYAQEQLRKQEAIICPEQTGKVSSCMQCGLCWTSDKHIIFKDH